MRNLLMMVLMMAAPAAVASGTPDGLTPAEETVCDGLTGSAFGLCNAYCEAMDCDHPDHSAADVACDAVRENFERKTGTVLPCEEEIPA